MATIAVNQDGTATLTLTAIEQQTLQAAQDDAFAQYVTLWLEERAKHMWYNQFKESDSSTQAAVLTQLTPPPRRQPPVI